MGSDWAGLTDGEREPYVAAAKDATDDLWVCTRVWEAWSVGTMTECDFRRASHDDDVVNDVAAAAYAAGATLRARAESAERRLRITAALIIKAIGSVGPEDAEDAARRLWDVSVERDALRARAEAAEQRAEAAEADAGATRAAAARERDRMRGNVDAWQARTEAAEQRAEALAAELAQARADRDEAAATAGAAAAIATTAQAEVERLRVAITKAVDDLPEWSAGALEHLSPAEVMADEVRMALRRALGGAA